MKKLRTIDDVPFPVVKKNTYEARTTVPNAMSTN